MNKSLSLAVAVLFSGLLIAYANAGSNDPAATPAGQGRVQKSGKAIKSDPGSGKKPGYSVAKDYDKRVANKKRAAEMRKKMIQEGK